MNFVKRHFFQWAASLFSCCLWTSIAVGQPTPTVQTWPQAATGRIERMANFPSKHVDARNIDIWLPDNFDSLKSAGQHFNVIYMHDGQMLFDARTTWNKQAWNVDQSLTKLMKSGLISPTMVVGIWNNGQFRHSEYFPQKFLPLMPQGPRDEQIAQRLQGQAQSDAYLRFLVEELKPTIDVNYPTSKNTRHNILMGASMGGLISIYALSEYPWVFGAAAGLSTHWMGTYAPNDHIPKAAAAYLRERLPPSGLHKIYQDHGTLELDAHYGPYQKLVDQIMRDKGYVEMGPQANYMTRVFEGKGHNERAWAERLEAPILFLLGR